MSCAVTRIIEAGPKRAAETMLIVHAWLKPCSSASDSLERPRENFLQHAMKGKKTLPQHLRSIFCCWW